jgi:hypothetical protein
MSKLTAFMVASAVTIAVWLFAPIVEPSLAQIWLTGSGRLSGWTFHGAEIVAAACGLAIWITALHFPPRPRHIWIRHSAPV